MQYLYKLYNVIEFALYMYVNLIICLLPLLCWHFFESVRHSHLLHVTVRTVFLFYTGIEHFICKINKKSDQVRRLVVYLYCAETGHTQVCY